MTRGEAVILVVDDEPDILHLLDYNLKKAGFRVLLAKDGPEAIETARSKKPDLILLDIMPPGYGGDRGLEETRQRGDRAHPGHNAHGQGREVDKIVGFELSRGLHNKAVQPREMVLRVKAVLKRATEAASDDADKVVEFLTS